jgi:hypothetical protein
MAFDGEAYQWCGRISHRKRIPHSSQLGVLAFQGPSRRTTLPVLGMPCDGLASLPVTAGGPAGCAAMGACAEDALLRLCANQCDRHHWRMRKPLAWPRCARELDSAQRASSPHWCPLRIHFSAEPVVQSFWSLALRLSRGVGHAPKRCCWCTALHPCNTAGAPAWATM